MTIVDPSIPLSVRPLNLMSPLQAQGQALSLQQLQGATQLENLKVQQGMMALATQQKMAQLFSNPAMMQNGMPTDEAISEIAKFNPAIAQGMAKTLADYRYKQVDTQFKQTSTAKATRSLQSDMVDKALNTALVAQDAYKSKFPDDPAGALKTYQDTLAEQRDVLKKSGNFPSDAPFAYVPPEQAAMMSPTYQTMLKAKIEENRPQSALGKLEADYRAGKVSQADYEANKAKLNAPRATTINLGGQLGTPEQESADPYGVLAKFGYSKDGAESVAFNRMFNNKYPTGGRSQLTLPRNSAIDNLAASLASKAGLSMEEMAMLPASKKADAMALVKQVGKASALEGTFNSFENNIQSWDQVASGIPPTMAGPLSDEVKSKFKKIPFSPSMSVNDMQFAISKEFNDPSTVAYLTATMSVAMDYARIMSSQGQSAARITDSAIAEAQRLIPAGLTPESRQSLKAVLTADANGQLQGINKTVDRLRSNLGVVNPRKVAPAGVSATTYPTATNKQTGEKLMFKDGKWQPLTQ